jgi:hypothetical protein
MGMGMGIVRHGAGRQGTPSHGAAPLAGAHEHPWIGAGAPVCAQPRAMACARSGAGEHTLTGCVEASSKSVR